MSNGDDSGALSRSAGFAKGFASSFLQARQGAAKAQAEQAAAAEKRAQWQAHDDLLRELAGNKDMTGQELIDYGRSLGMGDKELAAFEPGKNYDAGAGKAWITRVAGLKDTGIKEKGKNDRAGQADKLKRDGYGSGGGAKKPMDLAKMEAQALRTASALAGIPAGVAPGDPGLPEETMQKFNQYYGESLQGQKTAWETTMGKSSGLEAQSPYESVTDPGILRDNKVKAQPLYKIGGPMPQVSPASGLTPPPASNRGAGPPAAKKPITLDQMPSF